MMQATEYTWNPEDHSVPQPIKVAWRGHGMYAVLRGSFCWDETAADWEFEPQPSSRDDEFIARTRYSVDDALRIGERLASGFSQAPQ